MGAALDLLQACYLLTRSLLAQIWRNVRALDLEAQPVRADCPGPSVNPHTAYGNYGQRGDGTGAPAASACTGALGRLVGDSARDGTGASRAETKMKAP